MSEVTELCYPEAPDPNGSAKKYYKRRAYYFGRHNTPESLFLFAEWKRRLIETGTPPEVRTIRADLEHERRLKNHLESGSPNKSHFETYRWPAALVIAAVVVGALGLAFKGDAQFGSNSHPAVDGVALTEDEVQFIRGMRIHTANKKSKSSPVQAMEAAAIYHDLVESGYDRGPIHEVK